MLDKCRYLEKCQWRFQFLISLLLFVIFYSDIFAQTMAVPIRLQYPIFLKILTFDRNLMKRSGEDLNIGIVFQKNFKGSRLVKDGLIQQIKNSKISKVQGMPVCYTEIDLDKDTLAAALERYDINILYIAPLRAVSVPEIGRIAHAKNICTLTGVVEYLEQGLAVGVGIKKQKPEILINLRAAKVSGADFSSKVLKLANIIE